MSLFLDSFMSEFWDNSKYNFVVLGTISRPISRTILIKHFGKNTISYRKSITQKILPRPSKSLAIAVFGGAVLKLKRSKLDSIEAGLAAVAEAVFVAATVCPELCVVLTSFSLEQGNLLIGIDNKSVRR